MARYNPTPEEIAALVAAGWRHAPEQGRDWFWPPNELGYGYTYTEAVREQRRREKAAQAVSNAN